MTRASVPVLAAVAGFALGLLLATARHVRLAEAAGRALLAAAVVGAAATLFALAFPKESNTGS
jgi:hypothetical protein